jgi:hypothetical protein
VIIGGTIGAILAQRIPCDPTVATIGGDPVVLFGDNIINEWDVWAGNEW